MIFTLIKTKFFLPQPTSDYVVRDHLLPSFERLKKVPIMLVSAPSGYGKSTLVADFLSRKKDHSAWLSLSEDDNNLPLFIYYFIKAIQEKLDKFGEEVIELLHTPEPPPIHVITSMVINEMADLKTRFYLALDDYHLIFDRNIHQFVEKLFDFQQPNFRMILICRRDPDLPLSKWRSKNLLVDVRSRGLSFNGSEIASFIEYHYGIEPADRVVQGMEKISEGWISGLRLLMLSASNLQELEKRMVGEHSHSHVFSRLIDDILNKQPGQYREYLLKLSVLGEFNKDLFIHICQTPGERILKPVDFSNFTHSLIRNNSFLIPLDESNNWFRFHHLFTDMLKLIANKEFSVNMIKDLKTKAAFWYKTNDFPEMAIKSFIELENLQEAVDSFSDERIKLLSNANWQQLERLFGFFPESQVSEHCNLALTRGWIHMYHGNLPEMIANIPVIEESLLNDNVDEDSMDNLLGEVEVMKAYSSYIFNIDYHQVLDHSKKALNQLSPDNAYPIGIAWIFYGGAMQAFNKSEQFRSMLYKELSRQSNITIKSHLLLAQCYLDWLDADLYSLKNTAMHLVSMGKERFHREALSNGWYFYGMACYLLNHKEEAFKAFREVFELKYFTIQIHSFFGVLGFAQLKAESGMVREAKKYINELEMASAERGGPVHSLFTKVFLSEFRTRYLGDKNAMKWAIQQTDIPLIPMTNFSSPQLALTRIFALDSEPSSWKKACEILDQVIPFLASSNNQNFLARFYIVYAVIAHKQERNKLCVEMLEKAIRIAEPVEMIQPFLEMGGSMQEVLKQNELLFRESVFFQKLMSAFDTTEEPARDYRSITARERQILRLMDHHLSNKEIGNELFISESTVKRHIANMYKKLNVSNRQEAIRRANDVELI